MTFRTGTGPQDVTTDHIESASAVLTRVVSSQEPETITIDEILAALHHRGFGLLFILLAIPNLPPIPMIPGVSTLFGIPMFLLALQWTLGRDRPTLPRSIGRRQFNRNKFNRAISKVLPLLRGVEKLARPKYEAVLSRRGEVVLGCFAMIFAIVLAAPLPFSNLLPAYGMAALGIGLLERDGRFAVIGWAIGVAGIFFLIWIWTFAITELIHFVNWLFG
ncbi:MAG: exopolysaccharide biosynthesis protein [Alphaproteobacteria bacterium]